MNKRLIGGLIILVFTILSQVVIHYRSKQNEQYILSRINIDLQQVSKISIFKGVRIGENDNRSPIKVLGKSEIQEFVSAVRLFTKIRPNHPNYIKEWEVAIELTNGELTRIRVLLEKNDHKYLHIDILGQVWFSEGTYLKSEELYQLMAEYGLLQEFPESRRREIWTDLSQTWDTIQRGYPGEAKRTAAIQQAREALLEKYHITLEQLREIQQEGISKKWKKTTIHE